MQLVERRRARVGATSTLEPAPKPATLSAECDSTRCVTDALASSLVEAAKPYLERREVREDIGRGFGQSVSRPLWSIASMVAYAVNGVVGTMFVGLSFFASNAVVVPSRRSAR